MQRANQKACRPGAEKGRSTHNRARTFFKARTPQILARSQRLMEDDWTGDYAQVDCRGAACSQTSKRKPCSGNTFRR